VRRERAAVTEALQPHAVPSLPVVVRLERIGWNELDDDNLRPAFKAVRDAIAAWLGCDDRDRRIRWEYGQRVTRKRRHVAVAPGRSRVEAASAVWIVVEPARGADR
jgi:hypothetical protein